MKYCFDIYEFGKYDYIKNTGTRTSLIEHAGKLLYITSINKFISYVISDKWQETSTISIEVPYTDYIASAIKVRHQKTSQIALKNDGAMTDRYTSYFQIIAVRDVSTGEILKKAYQITKMEITTADNKIVISGESLDRIYYKSLSVNLYRVTGTGQSKTITKIVNNTSISRLEHAKAFSNHSCEFSETTASLIGPYGSATYHGSDPYLPQSLVDALSSRTGNIAASTIFKDAESTYDAFCKAVDYDPNNSWPYTKENFYRPLSAKYDFSVDFYESPVVIRERDGISMLTQTVFDIVEERDARNFVFLSLDNRSITELNYSTDSSEVKMSCVVPRSSTSTKTYTLSEAPIPPTLRYDEFSLIAIKPVWMYGYQSSDYPDYYKDWYNSIHQEPTKKNYALTPTQDGFLTSYYKNIEVTAGYKNAMYIPGIHYTVGDLVTIVLPDGTNAPALCNTMNITEDGEGLNYHPEFTIYLDSIVEPTTIT